MREELKKKRVLRACDTCRVKKAKCDGAKPCLRCQTDNQVCTYAHRRKQSERVFTNEYVELLESKLQTVLKSFMFLINEIGEGKDCSKFVSGPDSSVSTVIEKLSDDVRRMKDTTSMDQKVAQILESSDMLLGHDTDHSDYERSPSVKPESSLKPRARRGRPPKRHTLATASSASPISRPEPKQEPVTPPPMPVLQSEELDKTKNSLIMNWQNPSVDSLGSFDIYRSSFDDSYLPQEAQYAENLVLNDELLSSTSPSQYQVPEFEHPAEYDQPMHDFENPYQYDGELKRSISVEM